MKIKKKLIPLAVGISLLLISSPIVNANDDSGTDSADVSPQLTRTLPSNRLFDSDSNLNHLPDDSSLPIDNEALGLPEGSKEGRESVRKSTGHAKNRATWLANLITMAGQKNRQCQARLDSKAGRHQTKVLTDQMNRFAKQRQAFHYPEIGNNTRDLGGYPARHGYYVQPGRLIRSADLQTVTHTGIKKLKHMHVNKVIDLRYAGGEQGIAAHPDPDETSSKFMKDSSIRYQNAPVYSRPEHQRFHQNIIQNGEIYYYGWPAVTDKHAINAYRTIFKDALDNKKGGILYHCTLGRDRTGTTSVLLLSALGVSKANIYKDYLLTDYYHHQKPYLCQKAELDHFYSTINSKYGSVNHYLHSVLKLSNSKLRQLRREYLVKGTDLDHDLVEPDLNLGHVHHHDRASSIKRDLKADLKIAND